MLLPVICSSYPFHVPVLECCHAFPFFLSYFKIQLFSFPIFENHHLCVLFFLFSIPILFLIHSYYFPKIVILGFYRHSRQLYVITSVFGLPNTRCGRFAKSTSGCDLNLRAWSGCDMSNWASGSSCVGPNALLSSFHLGEQVSMEASAAWSMASCSTAWLTAEAEAASKMFALSVSEEKNLLWEGSWPPSALPGSVRCHGQPFPLA